jgi:hypothetical protein
MFFVFFTNLRIGDLASIGINDSFVNNIDFNVVGFDKYGGTRYNLIKFQRLGITELTLSKIRDIPLKWI